MKKIVVIFLFTILAGCSHSIRRYGYETGRNTKPDDTCHISFHKNLPTDTTKYVRVGRIKLGDTGFSTKCHENDAIQILKREACILGADAVNILDETRSDFWSTCYRVEAEFLKKNGNAQSQGELVVVGGVSSDGYKYDTDTSAVMTRVEGDKKRNVALFFIACGVGFLAGFLMTFHP